MGLWDAVRGVSRPKAPRLDNLFALPGAAITMETALQFLPTGSGSVCYRAAEGAAAVATRAEAAELVALDEGQRTDTAVDGFGFTWLTLRTTPPDMGGLVTELHAINASLEAQGFGSGLLCSVVGFRSAVSGPAYLVYLYKQGTFYPFCPTGPSSRDTLLERQIRDAVSGDLPIEPDASRWLPLWSAPGLD